MVILKYLNEQYEEYKEITGKAKMSSLGNSVEEVKFILSRLDELQAQGINFCQVYGLYIKINKYSYYIPYDKDYNDTTFKSAISTNQVEFNQNFDKSMTYFEALSKEPDMENISKMLFPSVRHWRD